MSITIRFQDYADQKKRRDRGMLRPAAEP